MTFLLECIGKDKKSRTFDGILKDENGSIRLSLIYKFQSTRGTPIDFQLIELDTGEMRVSDMYIDNDEFKSLGIPEKLILKAKELLGKTVVSSTRFQNNGEHLHEPAKKVWERLKNSDEAYYDKDTGRYKTK